MRIWTNEARQGSMDGDGQVGESRQGYNRDGHIISNRCGELHKLIYMAYKNHLPILHSDSLQFLLRILFEIFSLKFYSNNSHHSFDG